MSSGDSFGNPVECAVCMTAANQEEAETEDECLSVSQLK